jgi:hypothetical protein
MGDRQSVSSVIDSLVTACKIVRPTTYTYKPDLNDNTNSSRPKPEQVIQYYRASSFVLSLDGYNNTFALTSNAPSNNNEGPKNMTMVPLPNTLNQTFLNCINSTIGGKVPLIVAEPILGPGAITGIAIGGFFALIFLFLCCKHCCAVGWVSVPRVWRKLKPRKKSSYVS